MKYSVHVNLRMILKKRSFNVLPNKNTNYEVKIVAEVATIYYPGKKCSVLYFSKERVFLTVILVIVFAVDISLVLEFGAVEETSLRYRDKMFISWIHMTMVHINGPQHSRFKRSNPYIPQIQDLHKTCL